MITSSFNFPLFFSTCCSRRASSCLDCLAGFSLSGVLDALTSYGTLLFWPFSDQRVALNLIAVVDPVFSMILLTRLLLGLWLTERRFALAAHLWGCCLSAVMSPIVSLTLTNKRVFTDRLRLIMVGCTDYSQPTP